MVWDPKSSVGHNDYGSFERQEENTSSTEEDKQLRGRVGTTLPLSTLNNSPAKLATGKLAPTTSMSDTDLYQRQPLIPHIAKNGHTATVEFLDDAGERSEDGRPGGSMGNGVVKINLPSPSREEPRFPKEKWKTLVAFLCLVASFLMSVISLSLVHERVPGREPLPDIFFEIFPPVKWALDVSEIIIMISTNLAFFVMIAHKHRFIVFRRMFLIVALLYLMRSVTMYVTVLPVSNTDYFCSPKANHTTPWLITKRVFQLISGFGLSINGKHTYCGDFIYSGHTVILTISYLLINEYTPKRLYFLSYLSFGSSAVGIIMVMLSHGHYTIDVIIAYFVTTRVFYIYHTLANNHVLKESGPSNYLARLWWYPLFQYFEKNVGIPLPRQHDWPLPWPRRFLHKPPNRDS